MRLIRSSLSTLATDRRAVMALEFAFLGMACMALIAGTMQIGFCLYAKATLNFAAVKVARQLQTGLAQSSAAAGLPTFTSVNVCAAVSGLLDCNAIAVTLYPVQDYLNSSSVMPFDPGISKSLMLLRLTYTSPLPTWPLQVGTGAQPMLITAAVPFVNEY